MREGFRSGSKLRKGRISLGLGHKGSRLLLAATTELSVGVMEGCMPGMSLSGANTAIKYSTKNESRALPAEVVSRFNAVAGTQFAKCLRSRAHRRTIWKERPGLERTLRFP